MIGPVVFFSLALLLVSASTSIAGRVPLPAASGHTPLRLRSVWPERYSRWLEQRRWMRARLTRKLVAGLAPLVDSVARSMRSGASLRQALSEVETGGPLGIAVDELMQSVARGRPLDVALADLPLAWPCSEVRIAATALALAAGNESGTALALDGVGESLRDLAGLEAELRALTAQVRASMYVTAALPLLFFGVTALVDPSAAGFLVTSPFGRFCLALGIGLDAVGFLWMRRLVRRLR